MSTDQFIPQAKIENLRDTIAARKVRHIIETAVVPRVELTLEATRRGEPVMACPHITDAPDDDRVDRAAFDWLCEGVGLLCQRCLVQHVMDRSTPHRDPRHDVCIRCGAHDDGRGDEYKLHPLTGCIELHDTLMVWSQMLRLSEEVTGKRIAAGIAAGHIAIAPIAWACDKHKHLWETRDPDDHLLTLHWPRLHIEERRHSLVLPPKAKSKNKGKRKKR